VLAAVHFRCHSELRYNGTRIGLYLVVLSRTQIKLSRSQTEYGSLRVIRTIDTFKAVSLLFLSRSFSAPYMRTPCGECKHKDE
jgi:hypothetical protein